MNKTAKTADSKQGFTPRPCACKIVQGVNYMVPVEIEFCPLHAAAPELLAACKELLGKKTCGHDFDCICASDMARAAIKRAERRA